MPELTQQQWLELEKDLTEAIHLLKVVTTITKVDEFRGTIRQWLQAREMRIEAQKNVGTCEITGTNSPAPSPFEFESTGSPTVAPSKRTTKLKSNTGE